MRKVPHQSISNKGARTSGDIDWELQAIEGISPDLDIVQLNAAPENPRVQLVLADSLHKVTQVPEDHVENEIIEMHLIT